MEETKKIDYIYVNKMYRYMKNDMQIETFMDKFHFKIGRASCRERV